MKSSEIGTLFQKAGGDRMQQRLMTECEWRKQARLTRQRPTWWGAQCIYPFARKMRVLHDRSFHRFMLMISVLTALLIPLLIAETAEEEFVDATIHSDGQGVNARQVNAISYVMPENLAYVNSNFSYDQLLRGKMLLLDEAHPLPQDISAPDTASIAKVGNGMVPVRSLSIKTGRETINALMELFVQLRQKGVDGIYVWQGSTTRKQQKNLLIQQMRQLMDAHSPEEAARMAYQMADIPGTGDLLQEYAVELRFVDGITHQPDERALEDTPQGQTVLQLAWRYGFVRTDTNHPYRFRYVGKAHATAMTYLDLCFADYLEWLHQKGVIVVSAGGQPQYLIMCKPLTGKYIAFDIPVGASYEISLDNTGYAMAACTL